MKMAHLENHSHSGQTLSTRKWISSSPLCANFPRKISKENNNKKLLSYQFYNKKFKKEVKGI